MRRSLCLVVVAERTERLLEQLLQVRLANIDHVVCGRGASKMRRRALGGLGRRGPERGSIELPAEASIEEVATQETEFPELIGDVLADVRDGTVRADDHLLAIFIVCGFL